jgi:hypothetical protein
MVELVAIEIVAADERQDRSVGRPDRDEVRLDLRQLDDGVAPLVVAGDADTAPRRMRFAAAALSERTG